MSLGSMQNFKKRRGRHTPHSNVFYKKLIPCKGHKMEGGGAFEEHVKEMTTAEIQREIDTLKARSAR